MFLVFLRKINKFFEKKKKKKINKKKLSNKYDNYLYPKDYDHSIGTFSFNRYIFVQFEWL